MEQYSYIKSRNPFTRSVNELKSTRTLATCAMLLAVELILNYVGSFAIGPSVRVSFGFLPVATAAYLFGPVPAMIINAISDVLMVFLKPIGAYFPGFTLTAALGGLFYGLMFYGQNVNAKRIVVTKLLVDLFLNLGLNTLWIQMMQGKAFMLLMPARAIKNMLQLPVDVLLLMVLFSSLGRVFRALGRPMPERVPATGAGKKRLIAALVVLLWIAIAIWFNNTSLIGVTDGSAPKIAVSASDMYVGGAGDSVPGAVDKAFEVANLVAVNVGAEAGGGTVTISDIRALLYAHTGQTLLIELGDEVSAEALWRVLKAFEPERLQSLIIRGNEQQMRYLSDKSEEYRVVVPSLISAGMRDYMLLGWLGYVPDALSHTMIELDYQGAYAKWGFPAKFVQRMTKVNTYVMLIKSAAVPAFDQASVLDDIPGNYSGYVWTAVSEVN